MSGSSRSRERALGLARRPSEESGGALVLVLLVTMVLFGLGAAAVTVAHGEIRVAENSQGRLAARVHAEAELDRLVGLQNDLSAAPRYLFDASNYVHRAVGPNDTSVIASRTASAPLGGGVRNAGTVQARILGKDPVTESPPYTVETTATLSGGSSASYQAVVDVISLLDFAVFSDDDIHIAPNITVSGRLYSGDDITLVAPFSRFLQRVEYADRLNNQSNGNFRQGHRRIPPLPSISSLVNMSFFESASQSAGVCSNGIGLYIGTDGPGPVDAQTNGLFRAHEGGSPAGHEGDEDEPGCRDGGGCYAIDLGLFDFSASPVTYAGQPLVDYNGAPLVNFNGVIWVDDEVHVWGHHGGRSVEEGTVTDGLGYMTPPPVSQNAYSNDVLDPNEDGSGGGVANGRLDGRNRGVNMGIYADENLYIDHNVFAGSDTAGNPARVALVARWNVRIDGYSPRTVIVEAPVLSVNESWRPAGDGGSHPANEWADNNGSGPPNSFVYDLDADGTLETDNGVGQAGDRDETDMLGAWTLRNLGNLVVEESPHSGPWSAYGHPRWYTYDTALQTAEIPCYPTLPNYGVVPGSFTEVSP